MAKVSIHDISAEAFMSLPIEETFEFLAEVAEPWIDAGEDGGPALPTSYSILFERRVAQLAQRAEVSAEVAMALILERARQRLVEDDADSPVNV